jgi:hypothetical protein
LKEDAEKALSVLIEQPEVDKSKGITVIGHSEGTIITPRVAIDNPDKVSNLVLMGAQAENIKEASYFQSVTLPVLYAQNVLDHSHDGLLSVNEATHNPVFQSMFGGNFTLFLIQENITAFNNLSTSPDNKDVSVNGTTTIFNDLMQDDNDDNSNVTTKTNPLHPKYNIDKDSYISISNELRPAVERDFEEFIKEVNVTANSASSLPPPPIFHEKCIDLSGCPV